MQSGDGIGVGGDDGGSPVQSESGARSGWWRLPEPEPEHEARTTELIIISFHSKSNSFLNIILSRALEICPEYKSSMQLHF